VKRRLANTLFSGLLLFAIIATPCYGEQSVQADPDYFTIAVLPDTQYYSEGYPYIFDQQTQWIVDNAQSLNIVFVAHLGDIQDDSIATQWQNALHSMSIIRNSGIPYSVIPGNNDEVADFDIYFPYTDFTGYSWYGGHYPSTSNASNFELLSALGQDFIILNLVYEPSLLSATTNWANSVLTQYSSYKAIVITHGYIDASGNYTDQSNVSGIEIWNNIVKLHSNVIAVLCGHIPGEYYNTATGLNGNTIYNLLSDYQTQPHGGDGWLRLYKFYPRLNKITAITYSPYLDEYDTSAYGQFDLYLDMSSTLCTISASVNGGNGMAAADPMSVNYGGSSTITLIPDDGYVISSVTDNGANVTAQVSDNTYVISDIGTDHNIVAMFAQSFIWDLNQDHVCDVSDLVAIGLHWGQTGISGWIAEDLNEDGVIDVSDLVSIGLHWGEAW
jgi:hypothetical protein